MHKSPITQKKQKEQDSVNQIESQTGKFCFCIAVQILRNGVRVLYLITVKVAERSNVPGFFYLLVIRFPTLKKKLRVEFQEKVTVTKFRRCLYVVG